MRRPPGNRLLPLWVVLFGLLAACQAAPTAPPSETAPTAAVPSRTLPPPAQTRTVRSTPAATLSPTPSPTPTLAPSLLAVEPAELRGLTLQFWHPLSGEANTALQGLTAAFNQENPWGITVQPVSHAGAGALDDQMWLALDEKRLPALIAAYTDQARQWQAGGAALADLTPYLTDPAWGLSPTEQQDFYPSFWAHDLVRQGAGTRSPVSMRLGVPWYRSALVLFYNRTWAEELGFRTFPDTPEQFRLQVCAAAQANLSDPELQNDGTGGWLITGEPLLLVGWIHAFGGEIVEQAGNRFSFSSPAAEQAVQTLADLVAEGCAWSTAEEVSSEAFAARRALVVLGSLTSLPAQQRALAQAGSQDQWVVLPLPSTSGSQLIEAYGPSLMVAQSTPTQELAAWLFARWLLSPAKQAAWAEANSVFPVCASALQQARIAAGQAPQWEQALVWLPRAHSEPALASWGVMRGVLSDALQQILSPGFQPRQAGSLLVKLDQIAAVVQAQLP